LLQGTARADVMRQRIGELDLPSGPVGDPPEFLTGEALAEWNMLTSDPNYSPVLSPVFRSALIEYCTLHGAMIDAQKGGPPLSLEARRLLSGLRMQLGLTPASQSKVQGPKVEPTQNKWAAVNE
jgi:phage terminase small subunit